MEYSCASNGIVTLLWKEIDTLQSTYVDEVTA